MIDRPAKAQTPVLNEEQKLIASDGDDSDELGVSVAASGDVIAIGASSDEDNGLFSGSAYVFRWNGAQWVEEQKLVASDGAAVDLFGYSLDTTGEVIVVGSRLDDDNGADSGSAYVYRWNGAHWSEEQKLLASDGAQNDHFGESVAVSGDVIVVGALQDTTDAGLFSGSAYVYRWDGAQWVEEQKLLASDGAAGELFGRSVYVSGDVIAIGAPFDDDDGFRSGSAYVYRWNGVQWVEEQKLLAFDGSAGIAFGWSIAASGDVIVAGSPNDQHDNGGSSGSAYVFRWNGAQWVEEQKLLASDGVAFDDFHVVDVSGDLIVVGAGGDDNENGNGVGSGYVYRWNGAQWIEEWKLLASDGVVGDGLGGQQFDNGGAVAIGGNVIVVGAIGADSNGFFSSGAAYVFIPEGVADGTAPLVTDVSAIPNPVPIGTPIELTATVDDNEMGGSIITAVTYSIDGATAVEMEAVDGGFDEVTEDVGATLPAFTTTGIHEVCVTVVDAAGNVSAAECIALAVFDPTVAFVTGGGWIDSPAGAYPAEPDASGKASFGFVSRYHDGTSTPDGQTQFRLREAGLTFHSQVYDTLVVIGAEAHYSGSGRVNGNSGYSFLVAVIDGNLAGDGIDRFRLAIWQTAGGTVVYDSQPGDADTAPATTPLGGGNITIHEQ